MRLRRAKKVLSNHVDALINEQQIGEAVNSRLINGVLNEISTPADMMKRD